MTRARLETIGNATLYLGDCREVLPGLSGIDVCITDPPYGIDLGVKADIRQGHGLGRDTYSSYDDTAANFSAVIVPAIRQALSIASRGAVFTTKNLSLLPPPDAIGGIYLPSAVGRHCWGFNSLSLVAFYGKAPDLNKGSRSTVLVSTETSEANGHPCPKPLGWMLWVVGLASKDQETVLDPFAGSGTTGVACARLGRAFVGIERELAYFDIACRRIEAAQRQGDMLLDSIQPARRREANRCLAL